MEKMNPALVNPEAWEAQRQKKAAELLQDPEAMKIIQSHGIPAEAVARQPQRIHDWLQELSRCRNCTGLADCKQKRRGWRSSLRFDGVLSDTMETCRYADEKQKQEAHLEQYLISDLGAAMATASFEDIKVTDSDTRSYVNALMKTMTACSSMKGLYLYGNLGTGKTFLSACAANQLARQGKQIAFVHCPAFAERLRTLQKTNEHRTEISRMTYADFLVLDDIGAEEVNERLRAVILAVLDARMQNGRCTWFTSNYDFRTLQQHFTLPYDGRNELDAMRIMERIRALAEPLEIIGEDRRLVNRKGEKE